MSDAIKLFISYSWSTPKHEQWVLELAERLTADSVHVILDKWDLREGHDAHEFMEQMVTNPEVSKVAIIFDKEYARKADERDRGVGTETRLITGKIYNCENEGKFVAVLAEKDDNGAPYIPAYYTGRIYIDLADPSRLESEYERMLRWIYDKPLHVRPALGKRPAFLENESAFRLGNTSQLKRAIEQIREGKSTASAAVGEYLASVSEDFEKLRITRSAGVEFDQQVIDSIQSFLPTRENLINLMRSIARYQPTEENSRQMLRFFENCLPFFHAPDNARSYNPNDFDNFKFVTHELLLYFVAVLLDEERFDLVRYVTTNGFYVTRHHEFGNESMVALDVIGQHLGSLDDRNRRLKLQRFSLHADLLKDRSTSSGVALTSLAQADIVIFLEMSRRRKIWWPETSMFFTRGNITLPVFARASSKAQFEKIRPIIGNETMDVFKARVLGMAETAPRYGWEKLPVVSLVNIEQLCTAE